MAGLTHFRLKQCNDYKVPIFELLFQLTLLRLSNSIAHCPFLANLVNHVSFGFGRRSTVLPRTRDGPEVKTV